VQSFIHHNEGQLHLWRTLKKKAYYAGQARNYFAKNDVGSKLTTQAGPLQRYKLFFSRPKQLFEQPLTAVGMLFMKTCEFGFGAVGYVFSNRRVQT
jgi:hypothetical protein